MCLAAAKCERRRSEISPKLYNCKDLSLNTIQVQVIIVIANYLFGVQMCAAAVASVSSYITTSTRAGSQTSLKSKDTQIYMDSEDSVLLKSSLREMKAGFQLRDW